MAAGADASGGAPVFTGSPAPPAPPASEPPATPPTGTAPLVRGIDVSRAQGPGEGNAWDRWDVAFGFARSSSGAVVDQTFAGNWRRMRAARLDLRGAYHYTNGHAVEEQLAAILDALAHDSGAARPDGWTHTAPGESVVLALDIEPWDPQSRVTPDWVAAMASGIVQALIGRLRDLGANVGVYTSAWAVDAVPGLTAELLALGVWWWVADGSPQALAAGRPVLGLPNGLPLERVRFWQKGRRGAYGEPLPVDDDRWLGTIEGLRDFARGA